MVKASRVSKNIRWGLAAASAAVVALFAPHVVERLNARFFTSPNPSNLSGSAAPLPAIGREAISPDRMDLFTKLQEADSQWQPQEELLPNGSTRYLYRRRAGEPDLSLAELRSLVKDPPSFETEKTAINQLLETLRKAGVRVMLTPTLKKGAAAEWDHHQGTLRIQPHVMEKGSKDFLVVLNHEAIHVAQSCRGGSLYAKPQALGIAIPPDPLTQRTLATAMYAGISHEEKGLEQEAYGLQDDVYRAQDLVSKECKVKQTALLNQG
jgi:hypothetical protein